MFAFEKEKSKRILGVIMVSVGMALAAGKLLDDSCHQTVRSHRAHEKDRSLGCVSTANSSSTTSGLKADIQNFKAKVTMRRSYGFRTFHILELKFYHSLGECPVGRRK